MFGAIGGPDTFGRIGPIIPIASSQGEADLIDAISLQGTDVFSEMKTQVYRLIYKA